VFELGDEEISQPTPSDGWLNLTIRRAAIVYVVGLIVAGLFAGALWHWLSTPPNYTIGDDQGAIITEQGLSQTFAMDIWYVFIGLAVALAVGAFTWGLFHRLGWPVVLIAIVGALLVSVLCWQFGHLLGPRGFVDRIAWAKPGDRVPMDLDLHSAALVLVWPLVANVPVLLLALWSQWREAHR